MVAEPWVMPVTNPWLPLAFDTCATPGADEVNVTFVVIGCELPSEYEPVAVSCVVPLDDTDSGDGVRLMLTSDADEIVCDVEPVTPLNVASMVTEPTATVDSKPRDDDAFEMSAFVGSLDVHVAWLVSTCVVPSV